MVGSGEDSLPVNKKRQSRRNSAFSLEYEEVSMGKQCEFHFQEGFSGELVTVAVDGVLRAQFEARTRLQTGVAHIELVAVAPGQTVTIAVPIHSVHGEYQISESDHWVTINLVDNKLVIQRSEGSPGYL
jgi:hypothetical protein